ncbi:hypothetical protein KJ763_02790 [Patescibacteria group bacterium]|nr:hypothetical protein [Patescibacteria group bacterium]
MENLEQIKNSGTPLSEEKIKKDIKEVLELSPLFEKMMPGEQERLINETYEKYYKDKG